MTKKKKMIILICVTVGILIIAAGILYFALSKGSPGAKGGSEVAYVDSVAMITGLGSDNGMQNRFAGVVESQETTEIKKSSDKIVKEIFVKTGDTVKMGDPLFEYDNEDTALKLEQERINLESISNDITGYYSQISELQKEKANAPADEQLNYTMQIQTAQTNVKRAEYNKKAKQAEITKLENDLTNATVTAPMDGIIKEVNETESYDNSGNPRPFMSIMASGEYRIKGKVNEHNIWNLAEGQPVIIRSRIDDSTWTGTISRIDTGNTYESTEDSGSGGVMYMGGGGDAGQTSTNYAFYVTPDSSSDFMFGQHVFIELDNGQDNAKEGLWLSSMYMELEENSAYVWVANSQNRLERRQVELGSYDSALDQYEILSGLTAEEYIAFPGNLLKEGMECVVNDGTHTNSSDNLSIDGDVPMDGDIPIDGDMPMDGDMPAEDGIIIDDGAVPEDGGIADDSVSPEDGIIIDDGTAAPESGSTIDGEAADAAAAPMN